jgi:TolB-like protein
VLPFASVAAGEATGAADAATQATLAALHRRGVPVVSPNRVAQVLFRHRAFRWGGVDADTRQALAAEVGAASIVTGVVEAWEVAGDELEPEPEVTLALRLVDAASGRIAWTGARERSGWDGEGPFRLGRVYARGALLEGIVDDLMGPLLSGRPTARKGTLR